MLLPSISCAVRLYNNELFNPGQGDGDVLAMEPEPGYFSQGGGAVDSLAGAQR